MAFCCVLVAEKSQRDKGTKVACPRDLGCQQMLSALSSVALSFSVVQCASQKYAWKPSLPVTYPLAVEEVA